MYNYDIKMLREKIKETNVSSSNKWKVSNIIPLFHIISLSDSSPLSKMSCKKVNNISMKKEVYKFKFICVSYINLIQNKALKEQIDKCMYQKIDGKISEHMRKTIKNDSTRETNLIMFHENSNSLIFKVLGVVVYLFIEEYAYVYYLCLQREAKLSLLHRGFEDNSFYELLGIGVPEILLKIVSCYGSIIDNNSTLILTCRSKLVSYYLSKGFVRIEKKFSRLEECVLNSLKSH